MPIATNIAIAPPILNRATNTVEARTLTCFDRYCHCPNSCKANVVHCSLNEFTLGAWYTSCFTKAIASGYAAISNPAYRAITVVAGISTLAIVCRVKGECHLKLKNHLNNCCAILRE
jgi:hypothetical protein